MKLSPSFAPKNYPNGIPTANTSTPKHLTSWITQSAFTIHPFVQFTFCLIKKKDAGPSLSTSSCLGDFCWDYLLQTSGNLLKPQRTEEPDCDRNIKNPRRRNCYVCYWHPCMCFIFQAKELLSFFLKEIVVKVGFHVPYFVHKITFVLAYIKATILTLASLYTVG